MTDQPLTAAEMLKALELAKITIAGEWTDISEGNLLARALLAAHAKLGEREWRPIEDAPIPTDGKESEPFLVTNGKEVWATTAHRWDTPRGPAIMFSCHGAYGYEWEDEFEDPTHFMPLPTPPGERS